MITTKLSAIALGKSISRQARAVGQNFNNLRWMQTGKTRAGQATTVIDGVFQEQGQEIPFARAKLGSFVQEAPKLGNQYLEDTTLQAYFKRHVPSQVLADIEPDMIRFGDRVAGEMYDLHLQCEIEQPYVERFTAWGNKVDTLVTGPAWRKMHDIAAEEGLIAISYERKYAEWSRLYGLAKNYLGCASSGLYSCPLAMTDGAAKIIESLKESSPWLLEKAFPRLTSRKPETFWTSGQWMTEKRGGSDVANGTETVAVQQGDGSYKLYGYKWFSSATDADITFTLARVLDPLGQAVQGTKGLSLFYVEVRNEDGSLNNIDIIKLKNKLGTRQLPTAELLLDGTVAHKVSDNGCGVPVISDMLKVSRIHTACMALSNMKRMVNLSRDYSTRRRAFQNCLKDYPLHVQTLARMEVEARGALLLGLENMRLLGREDCGIATEEEQNLLRLLVPLSKLYSGKQAIEVASEGLESFGGQGYIEDTGLPSMLRDAQVLSIWEGTTNILSLDILRAISKTKGQVLSSLNTEIERKLSCVRNSDLEPAATKVLQSTSSILHFLHDNMTKPRVLQMAARDLAYSLSRTYTGALLVDHACSEVGTEMDVYTAQRWCDKDLSVVVTNSERRFYSEHSSQMDFQLVFDGYHDKSRL